LLSLNYSKQLGQYNDESFYIYVEKNYHKNRWFCVYRSAVVDFGFVY